MHDLMGSLPLMPHSHSSRDDVQALPVADRCFRLPTPDQQCILYKYAFFPESLMQNST